MPAPAAPRLDELPATFAAFPLPGALLLPGSRLPLNIFEPRYLALIDDVLAGPRLMAMIQPDDARPETPHGPALFGVGCLGRLVSWSETGDGRYLITLAGLIRFTVAEELPLVRGYRRLRGDASRYAADLDRAPPQGIDRAALAAALSTYLTRRHLHADQAALAGLPDDELVATLAIECPFDPIEKQALLEAPDATARARILLTILCIDSHG